MDCSPTSLTTLFSPWCASGHQLRASVGKYQGKHVLPATMGPTYISPATMGPTYISRLLWGPRTFSKRRHKDDLQRPSLRAHAK